jgi:hypothetical protein
MPPSRHGGSRELTEIGVTHRANPRRNLPLLARTDLLRPLVTPRVALTLGKNSDPLRGRLVQRGGGDSEL